MLGSKENSRIFFSASKVLSLLQLTTINLQIYRITLHIFSSQQKICPEQKKGDLLGKKNSDWESEKHSNKEKFTFISIYFLFCESIYSLKKVFIEKIYVTGLQF